MTRYSVVRLMPHYFCRLPNDDLTPGTDYVESFFRYIDVSSGKLVESAHVLWEEDMEGNYLTYGSHIQMEKLAIPVCS